MRNILNTPLIVLALGLGSASAPVLADQTYFCSVSELSVATRNDDQLFIDQNFQKQFKLTVGAKTVRVKVTTNDFRNHEQDYIIIDQGTEFLGTLKAVAMEGQSLDTLVMDGKPNRNGITGATITVQMPGVANGWHLNCQN